MTLPPVPRRTHAPRAAESLKLTPKDLVQQGICDEIIPEPLGGAHRDFTTTAKSVKRVLQKHFKQLRGKDGETLIAERYERYRHIGAYEE